MSPKAFSPRGLFNIAFFANVFEWYEFSIYGLLAEFIGLLFFKTDQSITAALSAFSLFALSYLARPIGSLFFGYLGDWRGRSHALKWSLMLMAVPTALVGLLPSYKQAGFLATGLLVILRLVQGFAAGGEMPSSACYVFDAAMPRYRPLLGAIVCASVSVGASLGMFVIFLLFRLFDHRTILDWAWRIPFLLSVPLSLYIAYIRRFIKEPRPQVRLPASASAGNKTGSRRLSLSALLPDNKMALLRIGLLAAFLTSCVFVFSVWMPFYLNHFLGVPYRVAYLTNSIAEIFKAVFIIAIGYAACFHSYHRLVQGFTIAILLLAYPAFKGLEGGAYIALFSVQVIFAFLVGGILGNMVETVGQTFQYAERSRGMNLVFTLPPAFLGGSAPLILTYLTDKTGLLTFPALYIMGFALLALPAVLSLKAPRPSPAAV